jgi:hypothetical protein
MCLKLDTVIKNWMPEHNITFFVFLNCLENNFDNNSIIISIIIFVVFGGKINEFRINEMRISNEAYPTQTPIEFEYWSDFGDMNPIFDFNRCECIVWLHNADERNEAHRDALVDNHNNC